MRQKVLVTDRDKCIGCKACVMACSFAQKRTFNPLYARIWVLRKESVFLAVPMICEQCSPSPCRIVCPTKAIIEDPSSGIIKIISERCIGCKVCMWVCPFRAITLDLKKKSQPNVSYVMEILNALRYVSLKHYNM